MGTGRREEQKSQREREKISKRDGGDRRRGADGRVRIKKKGGGVEKNKRKQVLEEENELKRGKGGMQPR